MFGFFYSRDLTTNLQDNGNKVLFEARFYLTLSMSSVMLTFITKFMRETIVKISRRTRI